MKKLIIIGILAVLGLINVEVSAQCPMCKTALMSNINGGKKGKVGNGINKGILFLLSAPYFLLGTAGFVWYRNNGKKKANARI